MRQPVEHGAHLAVDISDPDENDLELCWQRPPDEWPKDDGGHARLADSNLDVEAFPRDEGFLDT